MDIVVNYVAVLGGAVAMFAVGALWYSPILFGKIWMQEMGITPESMRDTKMKPIVAMAMNFVTALISTYVLYHFMVAFGVVDTMGALTLGFWVWLGFLAPIALHAYFWEGKSAKVVAINLVHLLVAVCAAAVVLVLL